MESGTIMSEILRRLSRELIKDVGDRSKDVFEFLSPAIDVVEDGSDLLIIADIAGFKKDDIHVRVSDSTLSIVAERDPVDYSGITYWKQRPLRIKRDIPLPVKVEEDTEVTGKYENGVLKLRVPLSGVSKVKID